MKENNFILDLIAAIKGKESQEQIKKDIDNFLSNIKVPLIGTLSSKTAEQLKKDIAAQKGMVNLSGRVDSKGVASSLQQATAQAQKQANAKPVEVGVDFAVKKDKLVNDIKLLAQQNSKLFKDTDMSIKYNSLLDNASIARNSVELSSLRSQLAAFKSELKVTGNMGLTLGDSLKKSLSKVMGLLGNFNVIMQLNQQLKNAWTEAKTLDDSLVDLQKVTDSIADRDALYKYFDKAMDKAQDLNVEVNSLIYAITEFKKLGWSLSDAELGGEWATILQNVGDVDIDTAIGSIKTAIASFDEIGGYTDAQMDKKLEAYTDLINNMSNRYSIDAQSLSEAIRLSAGTLTEAHTSIEQAATMFSTANKYYNDASYLGNTVKIGSLRVRASEGDDDAISELEEMGEEIDDLTVATSSLREKLLSLTGVDIMVDDQTFKSYYDQLYEISHVIDDLSDTSRANVLETLFGKNRSAAGAALLSGMKESADAYKDAINSAGSATKEYETWMQSADAASQRFANNLTKTYQSIINGNTVRDFTNLGSAVLEFANSWGLAEGALKGGLIIGAMKGITNLTVALKNSAVQVSNYGAALEAVSKLGNFAEGTSKYADEIKKLKTSCSVLTDTQLKQVLAHKNLSDSQLIEILQLKDLEEEQRKARLTQLGLTQATESQTEASMANLSITNMLRVAWTKFTTLAKANPMAVGITSIVAATYAAMKASEAWTNRLKDQALESSGAYKDTLQEIESINSELQTNGQRIDELNAKENLTLVESEELERLKESNRELENTLALKEKIVQQEKATANKDAVKYFEEDTNKYNKETGTYNSTHIEVATQYLDEIYAKEQRIHELELEMSRTNSNTEKYRELSNELDITQRSYDDLLQRVQDYNDVFTDLDDYLFEGQDDELIQQLNEFYNYMNEVLYGIAETHTDTIRDILAKVDFKDASKELEELGKSGELSVATLSSRFPELIEYLDKAGVSADELYQYIMALSDPDALNYAGIENQFKKSLGIRDGEINGASDQKLWDEVKNALGDDKWELTLEAYLKVRDQYGDHPEGWNAKDWVANIQSELSENPIGAEVSFSISKYEEQIDSIQSTISTLRSALDSFNQGTLDESAVIDLMQQFPALIPYIDLAADGFGNLSQGLSTLIAQQPDSLIQSLQALKESLNTDEERAQVDALINSLQSLSSYGDTGMEAYATSIGSTWSDTANVIQSVTDQFENLAKVQEAVADGLTISTTAAAELAKMYPEILTNAEYAGNGQIQLNEEVVKSILAGDESIINAQIAKLEADKAELEARRETAIAELEIANQVGTAKGQIDEAVARQKIALLNQELENEIAKNNQAAQSYAQAAESMALNTEQLGNYEADVADNMATNMNTASASMADGMQVNSIASQQSLGGIVAKAADAALAVAGIATGKTVGNPNTIYSGKGGTNIGGIKKVTSPGKFTSTVSDYIKGDLGLDEFKTGLEVDIQGYEKAISNIDSQIEVLKNLQSTFADTVNSANGGIGGRNYADKIKDLEKEKDKINSALDDANGSGSGSKSAKETKDEFEELFDFFERRIKVLDNALSLLKTNLSNVTGSFAKNRLIDAELGITEEKFRNYSDALNMYTQKANEALSKLPSDIAAKIKDGAVDITTFIGEGNEEVVDAIKDYEQWADKVADCKQELAELRTAIRQLELEKFNNIMEEFTNQFDLHEDGKDLISKQAALLKEAGELLGESFFTSQIDQSKKQLALLEEEKARLVEQMTSAVSSGRVKLCPLL